MFCNNKVNPERNFNTSPGLAPSAGFPVNVVNNVFVNSPLRPSAFTTGPKTSRCRSAVKNPMPHRPITPALASINPIRARYRSSGFPNNSPYEPSCFATPSDAETDCHRSGSFRRRRTKSESNAGAVPMRNMVFHPVPTIPITAAVIFPTADRACSNPNA